MQEDGVLKVHEDVVFQANNAGSNGGAVSLTFTVGLQFPGAVFCDRFCCS